MIRPCPDAITCEGSDFPIENYSAEEPELSLVCAVGFAHAVPPLGANPPECASNYRTDGFAKCCLFGQYSDALLCAQQAALKQVTDTWRDNECNPFRRFCNSVQIATVTCEDGSGFTATVAEGTICDVTSQADVDARALALAQSRARESKFCCPPADVCCCVGESFSRQIDIEGGTGDFTWAPESGAWPTGIDIVSAGTGNRSMIIQGTATVPGVSIISYNISDPAGNILNKTFTIYAIQISTLALNSFTLGVPYSQQLLAIGGSGSYAWRIVTGSLPAGLTMSIGGLISGTPTAATTSTILFEVVDLLCQGIDRSFFPPRVALTGRNVTTIATIKGFLPYNQTFTPPKKYKKLAWSGTSEQWAVTFATGAPCSGCKYIWSGVSEIDIWGNYISKYRKDFYAQCPTDTHPPLVTTIPAFNILTLEGYCWPPDPTSCPTCPPSPYLFVEDRASNSTMDVTTLLNDPTAPVHGITDFTLTNVSSSFVVAFVNGAINFPTPPQIIIRSTHNYNAVISDEYTDADALASATSWVGNGLVAESRPRTNQFTSTWTTVQFTLHCTDLLVGETYTARVNLKDSSGAVSVVTYSFVAPAVTHDIVDNIPTPLNGHTLEAQNPTIAFA